MRAVRALVHDPDSHHGLRLGDAPRPEPGPSEVLVQVAATSLNFGELAFLGRRTAPGEVAGWDAAGTVVAAAADGSGPPAGARVVTFGWSGAWAQQRVVVGLDDVAEPVDAALDNVGGQALADALALLQPGGCLLSVGMASLQPTTIDFEQARLHAAGARIEVFVVGPGFGADLRYLVSLLEAGELDPQIGWRGSWDRAEEAASALMGRSVRGKAVLEVSP